MGLFSWFKAKRSKKEVYISEGLKRVEEESVAVEDLDLFPYDITKVSSPVLIIAEKWKANPKRVKVGVTSLSRVRFFSMIDKVTKFKLNITRVHIVSYNAKDLWDISSTINYSYDVFGGDFTFNDDESNYLLSECKEALETRCNLVQTRYDRLKGYKKTLKENEERKRIQKLFEES